MINIQDLPTDPYSRYSKLIKELIVAEGIASRSEDNTEMLMKTLDIVCGTMGYKVSKQGKKRVSP